MADLIEFFSSNDNLIIIGLMSVIVILMVIILLIDVKTKRQKKVETEITEPLIVPEVTIENIEDTQTSNEITEIKYVETNDELEKTKAKIELENLKAELQKAELETKQEEKTEVVEIQPEPQSVISTELQKNSIDIFEDKLFLDV